MNWEFKREGTPINKAQHEHNEQTMYLGKPNMGKPNMKTRVMPCSLLLKLKMWNMKKDGLIVELK